MTRKTRNELEKDIIALTETVRVERQSYGLASRQVAKLEAELAKAMEALKRHACRCDGCDRAEEDRDDACFARAALQPEMEKGLKRRK